MKTHAEYNVKIPDYALSYLVNSDSSGLEEREIVLIDHYMRKYYTVAQAVNGSVIIDPSENESYFTSNPAFGLACNVVDTIILILVENKADNQSSESLESFIPDESTWELE